MLEITLGKNSHQDPPYRFQLSLPFGKSLPPKASQGSNGTQNRQASEKTSHQAVAKCSSPSEATQGIGVCSCAEGCGPLKKRPKGMRQKGTLEVDFT